MKKQFDERGVALILEVVLIAIVLAAVGFAGYRVYSSKKAKTSTTSGSTNATKAAAETSCLSAYHDNDLCKFASDSTSLEKQAYQATVNETQAGQSSTITLKNDGNGNTELSGTGNGATFNSIELSGVTYVETSGTWYKYPSGQSAPTTDPTSTMDIGVGSAGITYKKLGTEACGSLTCFKYQVSGTVTGGGTQYVWFDNKDYKLREWSATDASGNTTDMKVTYQAINITAPSPVQNFPGTQ